MTAVNPIPEGYHSVTPYLIVDGAAEAIAFYAKAFGAVEVMRLPGPDGRIGHAEMKIGDSFVMFADEHPEMSIRGPRSIGGTAVSLVVYVPDVDVVVQRAVAAGAKLTRPVADQFYGDRTGSLEDPFGHAWHVHTRIRTVSQAELEKAAAELAKEK